jgi:acetyltransferase-like isoleucine patch superfamily enzyme
MNAIFRPLVVLIKSYRIWIFNRKNDTKIESIFASTKAIYGSEVLISKDTYISDNVSIGDYSYVNTRSSLENCDVGKFCSISSGVYVCPFEHNISFRTTHPIIIRNDAALPRKRVTIGNDVLISLNVIILEGVTVGNGAVIGAGAVVTKDVKPYEVVGGIPAKHIKYRFNSDEIDLIENSRWWDWDKSKIIRNEKFLKKHSDYIIE